MRPICLAALSAGQLCELDELYHSIRDVRVRTTSTSSHPSAKPRSGVGCNGTFTASVVSVRRRRPGAVSAGSVTLPRYLFSVVERVLG